MNSSHDQSKNGRYEGQLWKAEMLKRMVTAEADKGAGDSGGANEDGEVNGLEDSGFFARWGHEPVRRQGLGQHTGTHLGVHCVQNP